MGGALHAEKESAMNTTIKKRLDALARRQHDRPGITTIEVCHRDEHGTITLVETIRLGHAYHTTEN